MSTNKKIKERRIHTMDQEKLRTILQIGETIAVEFKRCSNRIENDVYQSVCSFLNRFGGDIYLGEYSYAEEPTMSDRWLNQSKIIHFLQISS